MKQSLELITKRRTGKKYSPHIAKVVDPFYDDEKPDNMRMVDQARTYWESMYDARARANRTHNYYIGKQWSEMMVVTDKHGNEKMVTEEEYIRSQGRMPFVQNIMLQIGRNIVGQYQSAPVQSIVIARDRSDQDRSDMFSGALDETLDINSIQVLEPRQLESFINSGFILTHAKWHYWNTKDRSDVRIESVNYNDFFFNTNITDPRMLDLTFCGRIIDAPIGKIVSWFANDKRDEETIRQMFVNGRDQQLKGQNGGIALSGEDIMEKDFMLPYDNSLCRFYEIWELRGEWRMQLHDYLNGTWTTERVTQSEVDAINAERISWALSNGISMDEVMGKLIEAKPIFEQYWYYKFLTPYGNCLDKGESPYDDQSHPFIITAHPLLNGRVWSYNETLIDSQRQINRLLSLRDAVVGGSAKNTLVVAQEALNADNGYDIERISDEHSKINGTLVLKLRQGERVEDVIKSMTGNVASLGVNDMITGYIQMLLNASGISPAIQGQRAASGTPSSLYAQEAQNSQINLRDILNTFSEHKRQRDMKVLRLIRQYQNTDRVLRSRKNQKEALVYKATEAKAIKDIDVTIAQAMDTPVFRQLMDDRLSMFVDKGFMDMETYAELSSESWAEPLRQIIAKRKNEMQGQPLSLEEAQQLQNVQGQIQQGDTRSAEQQNLVANVVR